MFSEAAFAPKNRIFDKFWQLETIYLKSCIP